MQPPPSPPPQPPAAPRPGPSRRGYLAAALLLLVLFLPSLFLFLNGLNGIIDGLIRAPVPGETPVELEAGTWTLFYEYMGPFADASPDRPRRAPAITARLKSDDGSQLPVVENTGSFEYDFGGRGGYSIGKVTVDESGRYVLDARLVDVEDPERYVLALGRNVGRSTAFLVFGIFGMIGSGLIAFIVWLVVFILRYRAKPKPG